MKWLGDVGAVQVYLLSLLLLALQGEIKGLYRHAVKGLSADSMDKVYVGTSETFPDDRRFALLKKENKVLFDPEQPQWIHKQNFLCSFSDPQLMAKYRAKYSLQVSSVDYSYGVPCDQVITVPPPATAPAAATTAAATGDTPTPKILELYQRSTDQLVLGPLNLSTTQGQAELADFFSKLSGTPLTCVSADVNTSTSTTYKDNSNSNSNSNSQHKHQFGNTGSGWKQRKDTRTLHIVNAATVRQLSERIGTPLNPTRFRPNIVIDGPAPWEEFEWVGKTLRFGTTKLKVISTTVRCDAVTVDPMDHPQHLVVLDIPKLLVQHFPEHGPYLGVYAVVEEGGAMAIGDGVVLLE
jgi:uncharacterized protein YcbX